MTINKNEGLFSLWGISKEVGRGGLITLFALLVSTCLFLIQRNDQQTKDYQLRDERKDAECNRRVELVQNHLINMVKDANDRLERLEARTYKGKRK